MHEISTFPGLCNVCIFSNMVKNVHVISSSRDIFAFIQYLDMVGVGGVEGDFKKLAVCYISTFRKTLPVYLGSYTTIAVALPKIHEVMVPDKHTSNSIFCPSRFLFTGTTVSLMNYCPSLNLECMHYVKHVKEHKL